MTTSAFQQKIRDGENMGIPRDVTYNALLDKGYTIQGDPAAAEPGFFDQIRKRAENSKASLMRMGMGKQNLGSTALQIAGQGAGVLNDAIGAGISAVTPDAISEPIMGAIGSAVEAVPGLTTAIDKGSQLYGQFKESNPAAAADVEAVGNLAGFMPTGKATQLGSKALAQGAKSTALKGVRDNVADRLLQSSLDLNANQIRNIAKDTVAGEHPMTWLRKRGLIGDRSQLMPQLEELATTAKKTKTEALQGVPGRHVNKETDQALDEILKDLTDSNGNPKAGLEEKAYRAAFLRSLPEKSLAQIDEAKGMLDDVEDLYTKSNDPAAGIRVQGLRNLRRSSKEFIETQAQKAGAPDIKRLNKDIQVSRQILKALEHTGGELPYQKLIPMIKNVGSKGASFLVGNAIAGPLGGFAAVGVEHMVANPKVQAFIARRIATQADDEIEAVMNMLKTGKYNQKAKRIIDEVSEDLSEVLRMAPENQVQFMPELSSPTE